MFDVTGLVGRLTKTRLMCLEEGQGDHPKVVNYQDCLELVLDGDLKVLQTERHRLVLLTSARSCKLIVKMYVTAVTYIWTNPTAMIIEMMMINHCINACSKTWIQYMNREVMAF